MTGSEQVLLKESTAGGAAPGAGAHPAREGLGEPPTLGSWGGQSEGLVRGGGCGTGRGGPCRPSKDCGSWEEVEALSGPRGEQGCTLLTYSADRLLGRDSGAGRRCRGGAWTEAVAPGHMQKWKQQDFMKD